MYLHKVGHHSVVAADPDGLLYERLQRAGLPVLPFRTRNHVDLVAGFQLRRHVRAHAYHVVHFHTARAHALSPWLSRLGVQRIVTRRMDYPLRPGLITRFLYLHSVDSIVAISQEVKEALLAGRAPATRIRLIPSGINTSRFTLSLAKREQVRTQYGIAPHTPLVVSVGALVDRKGHDVLVTAASLLKAQGYVFHCLISGEGPLHSTLETQARTLDVAKEVSFLGFCADVPGLLSAADFFVHVPRHEGLGVAVMEALAAHLPTIASRVGGIPELIKDGRTGVLIPSQDATALAQALAYLFTSPQLARQLAAAGQAFAREHFDATVMAKANETLYIETCTDKS